MSYCVLIGVSSRFFMGVSSSFIGDSMKLWSEGSFLGVKSLGFLIEAGDDSPPPRSVLVDSIVTAPEDSTFT